MWKGDNKLYSLVDFIKKYDDDNAVKRAISDCITNSIDKKIALDLLAQDLQERLYEFIWDNEDLDIDDGSNVKRDFKKAIVAVLSEYFDS